MFKPQQSTLIHQLFESQVIQSPTAIAVTFGDRQLTYQELNQKANQIAHHLQSLGVKPETLVGVCIERSLEMVIVLFAILKAGGGYIPLDPNYPADRIAMTIEDSGLQITIAKQAQLANLPQNAGQIIVLEQAWDTINGYSSENPVSDVTADNVAYTIYTSGSTGKPKGVQVNHGTVVNLLESMQLEPGLTATDIVLAVITISFDMSIPEIFLPLSVGAKIVIASDREVADGMLLAQAITTSATTVMQATPATWRLLLATGWKGNRHLKIICGGEAMTRSLATSLLERCGSLWNMYGPTETTVYSAIYQVQPGDEAVPIGYPVANTQIYTISEQCRRKDDPLIQTSPGQPGEVYIGGDGLARGYLNQPEMTAEKFVPDPFSNKPGARLYRTGDLARLLPDGNIQYMGRVDHQVKIRGYRIELGDIEAALSQYTDVREVAVIVREDSAGDKRLVAYIVSKTRMALGFKLRNYLKEKLPEYMIPSTFVMMDVMPLTPNGKVDRRALPTPSKDRPELEQLFVAPHNSTEQKLATIWSQVLGIYPIGIHDNFFDLGGHSLLIAKMTVQLEETLQVKLPLSSFFEHPTIAGLAQLIDSEAAMFVKLCRDANYQPIHAVGLDSPEETLREQLGLDHQAHPETSAKIDQLNLENLQLDAILDPNIFPASDCICVTSNPQNILLTGVTGFLGAFLLDRLLRSTQANIYCQIRCPNITVGRQKLQRNLDRYALSAAQTSRIVIVPGDLSQPLFGMSLADFEQLAGQIDLIYHNGAFVNLLYPYAVLRDTNVIGTQEILRLASQVKVKPVHFISTLDVFQSAHHSQLDLCLEQDDFPIGYEPESGYAQSKWVAEKLVKTANERGIPTSIYRPGMIIGHSQTGVSNTEDQIGRLIKGLIQLESAPNLALSMSLAPVDYVCQAIVHLSYQPSSWGQAFHLMNPAALSLDRLVQQIRSNGFPLQVVEYEQWLKTLIDRQSDRENALTPMIPLLTKQSGAYANYLDVLNLDRVDCQNTIDGLSGTAISCPPIDTTLLKTYFSYFIQSNFLTKVDLLQSSALTS